MPTWANPLLFKESLIIQKIIAFINLSTNYRGEDWKKNNQKMNNTLTQAIKFNWMARLKSNQLKNKTKHNETAGWSQLN